MRGTFEECAIRDIRDETRMGCFAKTVTTPGLLTGASDVRFERGKGVSAMNFRLSAKPSFLPARSFGNDR